MVSIEPTKSAALHQAGSLVYYYMLGQTKLSIAVPIANSLTFVFTAIAGVAIGEPLPKPRSMLGILFVCLGIGICLFSQADELELAA